MYPVFDTRLSVKVGRRLLEMPLRVKYALLADSPVEVALVEVGRGVDHPHADTAAWETWPLTSVPYDLETLLVLEARDHAREFLVPVLDD